MKKFFIMMLLAVCSNIAFAQSESVDSVLKDIKVFVDGVRIDDKTTRVQMDSIAIQYKVLKNRYKYVKYGATDAQAKEYSYLTAQYKRKVSEYHLNKAGETIDRNVNSVAKWGRRQLEKVKGTVEGLTE